MCDEGVHPNVCHSANQKARKEHRCDACHEIIKPRQTYRRWWGVWDGAVDVYKQCARCSEMYDALVYESGSNTVVLTLDCGTSWFEAFGSEPPPEVAALAFALPGDFAAERSP